MTCALCMIVKNEEETLLRCLESVKGLFDEIVIVDTGSDDRTKETAHLYTDKVYDFEWCDDFSKARNFAFDMAKTDYAMWLDADDAVDDKNRILLENTLKELDDIRPDMVFMTYNVGFDENGIPAVSFERERIVRLGRGYYFEGAVHEAIPPRGAVIKSPAAISHLGKQRREQGRNLRIFDKLIGSGKTLSPRECYYYARELKWAGRQDESEHFYNLCIDDPAAWKENRISASVELAQMFLSDGKTEDGVKYLLKSLEFGAPRQDMCCHMGGVFMQKNDLEEAKQWYLFAVSVKRESDYGFIHADYKGYIPYIQLAVICDRQGDYKSAMEYNELAGGCKPNGREYLYNKKYFESKNI